MFILADFSYGSMTGSTAQHTNFGGSNLFHADLHDTDLSGARFDLTKGRFADFRYSNFVGVEISDSALQAANLSNALIAKAYIQKLDLRGAKLNGIRILASLLQDSHLEGSDLSGAVILLSQVDHGSLRASSLDNATILGATIRRVDLQASSFMSVYSWHSNVSHIGEVLQKGLRFSATGQRWLSKHYFRDDWLPPGAPKLGFFSARYGAWNTENFNRFQAFVLDPTFPFPRPHFPYKPLDHLADMDPNSDRPWADETEMATAWSSHNWPIVEQAAGTQRQSKFEADVAAEWVRIGCEESKPGSIYFEPLTTPSEPPYTTMAMIDRLSEVESPLASNDQQTSRVAAAYENTDSCPGAANLPDEYKEKLRKLKARFKAATPTTP